MKHFYLIGLSLSMLLFMGCTKQDTKQIHHYDNVGLKNSWHKTKEAVSESTEEFKEETK
jgi:hypothetical protein